MKELAIVLGTRPEIIKMAPVMRACDELAVPYYVVHTNQHYSEALDAVMFRDLALRKPDYNLEVGSGTHGQQTGRILERVEAVFLARRPGYVLVHGDVNTTLAAALASRKLLIRVGHVEAGLRSFDKTMPEEVNRILVDHMSDDCFSPTETARGNLKREGILDEKIQVVGNTIVDACVQNVGVANALTDAPVARGRYFLLTLHRAENTDDPARLKELLGAVAEVAEAQDAQVVFPVHPRTSKRMEDAGITLSSRYIRTEPLGYLAFLRAMSQAALLFTDSGGIQEEACIVKRPCVTLRTSTERPESVTVGANIVAGVTRDGIVAAAAEMLGRSLSYDCPYGDGRTSHAIMSTVQKALENA